jgi:hypothetical protein
MMDDRALLEAAAKAAGLTIHARNQAARDACGAGDVGLWISNKTTCWNPLTDDGDALRLAVKLGMAVYTNTCHAYARLADDTEISKSEEPSGDRAEATRRAIVRAAAAIGGAKP